ncbi:MAG TPA: beta-ketoacyl-ACP synthase II [Planktothrix sp.]|jgi:3-oxoacyl-[acyl-carrier-protein] synthase II
MKRVVVTGIGAITPYGQSENYFEQMLAGNSAVTALKGFAEKSLTYCHIAGQVHDFKPSDFVPAKTANRMDRFIQLAAAASYLARQDAGLPDEFENPDRVGVNVGAAAGGFNTIENNFYRMLQRGPDKCSPFTVPMLIVNMPSGWVSILHKAAGYSSCMSTACATGASAVGDALRTIQLGIADIMFAGGTEAPITPLCMAAFASSRVLSGRNSAPAEASRPFDDKRDGFVMSEGSCILILEELQHALKRCARIYAEVKGFGCVADAYDIVSPREDGDGAKRAMIQAMDQADWTPSDVDYINAHATSTVVGDRAEARAIKNLFNNKVLVSATKSMTGHMLGAAGAIEAAISCLAIANNAIPPTINLLNVDAQCHLNHVASAIKQKVTHVLSNSFGYGGHNTTLAFQAYAGT